MEARLIYAIRYVAAALRDGYPALVAAAACAVLVMLLWPQAPPIYVAEAVATLQPPGQTLVTADDAMAWLRSDEVLRAAVVNLRAAHPESLAAIARNAPASDAVAVVRDRMELVRLESPDELPRLAIGIAAPRRQAALSLASELARQLEEHHAAHKLRERMAGLEARERAASQELQTAQAARERLEVEVQGLRHAQLTSTLGVAQSAASTAAKSTKTPDRRWTELTGALESLRVERDKLLEIYLPAHPQIQSLSAQIARLEEALRRYVPEMEDVSHREAASPKAGAGRKLLLEWRRDPGAQAQLASGQEPLPASAQRASELMAALRASQLELLAATQRRQEAEKNWQAIEDERQNLQSQSETGWTAQAARVVRVEGGSQGGRKLAAALIAASLGGVAVSWLARRAAQDRPLATAAEVRSRFALPVLGTVHGAEEEADPAIAPAAPSALRFVQRCSEVVLLTLVLTIVAAAVLDRELMSDLIHDPVMTLGDLTERLL